MNTIKLSDLRQPDINCFKRLGIPYEQLVGDISEHRAENWLSGESVVTNALMAYLVKWVYRTTLQMEKGEEPCTIRDFDRIRFCILHHDPNTYSTCID